MHLSVIAPHPDDEALGAEGFMHRVHRESAKVTVCTVTGVRAEENRGSVVEEKRREALAAHRLLGVDESIFLDLPAKELDTVPLERVARPFAAAIKAKPTHVLVNHPHDLHVDHRRTFEAAMVATRPYTNCVDHLGSFQVSSSSESGEADAPAFSPTLLVDIAGTYPGAKQDAPRCQATEIKAPPHCGSPEAVATHACYWGHGVRLKAAEPHQASRSYA